GAAWSFACRARRTSASSLGVALPHACAAGARRPERPAPPGPRKTMAQGSPSVTRLPQGEVFAQRRIERLTGDEELVIHARRLGFRAKVLDMRVHFGAVC